MPGNNQRILIADDEQAMQVALADCLQSSGYRPIIARDGKSTLEMILSQKPDLILLDVMMPGMDGFSVCREVRRLVVATPIIFLSAKGQESDKVTGLDAGGDDYLVKPFSSAELLARVRANLRRLTFEKSDPVSSVLQIGRVVLDFKSMKAVYVKPGSGEIHFTTKEWQMLKLLARQPGKAISRDQFLDIVWGVNAFPSTRTVDNHIASIRSKIEPTPAKPTCLRTIHGHGYRLETDAITILHSHDIS